MKKIKVLAIVLAIAILALLTSMFCLMASAEDGKADTNTTTTSTVATTEEEKTEEKEDGTIGMKAIASAIVVGLVAAAGAIGMGMAIQKTTESMARQPEMADKINSTMMLGLVFIETAIIYALIIAILIIFVL